ncbi:Transcriptional regulator of ribosomal biogenesis proteins [Entomortierella beljakovae]|nr:Transcriptional regulator of ribosomal biogenesis proteins [Entomortierella beljakovae]
MAPATYFSNHSIDISMSIKTSCSSVPQYHSESEQKQQRQQLSYYHNTSCIDQTPIDYLNNPVDLQEPFFSLSCEHHPNLSTRLENEMGRVYSPSLLSSQFSYHHSTHTGDGNGGRLGAVALEERISNGNGGIDGSTAVSSTDHHHARDFETAFCRDFHCCGTTLCDLHALLRHYEECHVKFEEEDGDEDYNDYDDMEDIYGSREGSECCDEDSCSESESLSSYPSTTSPLLPSMLRIDGIPSSGSSDRSSRSASTTLNDHIDGGAAAAPAAGGRNLSQRSVFEHHNYRFNSRHHHRHYRHHPFPNPHPQYSHINSYSPTTHAFEAISASFGAPTKRKAVVSLADLYVEGNISGDSHTSAFGSTILKSSPSSRSNSSNTTNEHLLGSLLKRQALDSNRYGIISGNPFPGINNLAGTFPSNLIGGDGKPIGPLIGGNHCAMYSGGVIPGMFQINGVNLPAAAASTAGTADWARQRDEVFSILEDMTKTSSTATDESKPYRCTVLGCDKSYKNPNGLKYHNQHGHSSNSFGDTDSPESRPYACSFLECGKRYKNLNGLKYHIEHTHPNMIAALKAHQAALLTNMNPLVVDGAYVNNQAAAMTIAAALTAIEVNPMMAMAANTILTAHATAAATATASTATASTTIGQPAVGFTPGPIVTTELIRQTKQAKHDL